MVRVSSKGAPAVAARTELGAVLLIILALPRLVRLAYPAIWVEDDFYLEAAWLVSAGMRPYVDFVHPHFPLLEYLSAGYLRIFGASHFSIEILNEAAIYVTSLLTFKLAARVTTRRAATSAAILYATSSLVFRYHVYERECFVAPLVLATAMLALDEADTTAWMVLALTAACLIKLTAFIEVGVIVAFVALVRWRWRAAITLAIEISLAMILATGFCYWMYGRDFLFQTFIFHFMKGRTDLLSVMAYPLAILDLQIPLFVIGCVAVRREIRTNSGIVLVLAMVAAEYLFFGILSPTSWGHNYLEALPFITILGGIGVDWMIAQAIIAAGQTQVPDRQSWMPLAGCGVFILISILWIAPLENENWMQDSVYGFGFVSREEVARIGAALHDASRPDEEVLAPAFISFQANRRELIRFPETYGVLREAELEYQRDGFAAARAHLGQKNFFRLIAETAHFWRDPIIKSIQDGKLNAIVPDSPIQLLPLVIPPVLLPADFSQVLVDNGFRPVSRTDHFILWERKPLNDSRGP
jgi:Dolichyl-phosphate-mannose-protein mannosyltransferase